MIPEARASTQPTVPNASERPGRLYETPFRRYSTLEMKELWGRENMWLAARSVWVALARAQSRAGLVSQEELADLENNAREIDVDTIERREIDDTDPYYTGHDVLAAVSEFADRTPIGRRIIHQGATSEDILSNVEMLQVQASNKIINKKLRSVLGGFADAIDTHKDTVAMGWTHGQAAEPLTVGYRMARYAQDFLLDLDLFEFYQSRLRTKGIKGAVGTSASFTELLEGKDIKPRELENAVMEELGLEPVTVSGQTYPRKFVYWTTAVLASIDQSGHQFAGDIKTLQSSPYGEVAEPVRKNQRGSSAMPHKQNPNLSERVKSLARGGMVRPIQALWDASEVTLERGLEDSASKREYLPEAYLAADEVLTRVERIIKGLRVYDSAIERNMRIFGPFAATEPILTNAVLRGADRQTAYQRLSDLSKVAVEAVRSGEQNPIKDLIQGDEYIAPYFSPVEIDKIFEGVPDHIGDASERAAEMSSIIRERLSQAA